MNMAALSWRPPLSAKSSHALLDVVGARAIDRAAIMSGIPEIDLMERAGAATAEAIIQRWGRQPVLVMNGPGNNGGDGFVVARLLREAGWPVRIMAAVSRDRLSGAASLAAARWDGDIESLDATALPESGLAVDALFGIGLARPLEGAIRHLVDSLNERSLPVVAVDIASGVDSDSGEVLGAAVNAALTVTFFRRKPGHLLLPGRDRHGEIVVADLAVPADVYDLVPVSLFANEPGLWLDAFPWPGPASHKYTRGHAVVLGGTQITGAARLSAHAAQRIGAGLVTIAADPLVTPIYAAFRADLLVAPVSTPADFRELLADRRRNAVLLGPGSGADARLEAAIGAALDAGVGLVLDADSFQLLAQRRSNGLLGRVNDAVLMTPHEGEFQKMFGPPSPRLAVARKAARDTGAAILLKGSDTVIAAPDGVAAINGGAPPELATAGSGDVLAGIALGLMANRLPPFLAGLIACWVHGRAASLFGPGLLAGDLPDLIPGVLRELRAIR
jgi:NAD(P)H-hydrate epimerase